MGERRQAIVNSILQSREEDAMRLFDEYANTLDTFVTSEILQRVVNANKTRLFEHIIRNINCSKLMRTGFSQLLRDEGKLDELQYIYTNRPDCMGYIQMDNRFVRGINLTKIREVDRWIKSLPRLTFYVYNLAGKAFKIDNINILYPFYMLKRDIDQYYNIGSGKKSKLVIKKERNKVDVIANYHVPSFHFPDHTKFYIIIEENRR